MALKQYTFEEKRANWLSGMEKQLLEVNLYYQYSSIFGYQQIIKDLFSKGYLHSNSLKENVDSFYGYSDDVNDPEYKMATILFLVFLIQVHYVVFRSKQNEQISNTLVSNIAKRLKDYMPEYKIDDFLPGEMPKYEPTETKTVTDNLKDIHNELADPIAQLLHPMKNENELIGLISKVYKDIEKIGQNQKDKLNVVDKSILSNAQNLAKMLVNNVDSAKGHKGKSELTVKDIAHNFALNASLIQKLIQINNNKKD